MFARLSILFLLLSYSLVAKEKVKTYWEENGLVAVDLEDFEAKKPWKKETELKGFSGSSYYTWKGGNSYGSAGGGEMEFQIIISKPGDYLLNFHNRHEHKDSTEGNDCYTQMDDGRWVKTFSSQRAKWFWQSTHEWDHKTKIPAKYTLSAGLHTFRISGRSHGFSIDRFHLSHTSVNKKTSQSLEVKLSDSDLPAKPTSLKDKRLTSYWETGKFGMVVKECNIKLSKGESQEAQDAIETIEKFVSKRKSQLSDLREFAPSLAYESLKNLGRLLSYTVHEKEIKDELFKLSKDKSFLMSLQAEKIYNKAIKLFDSAKAKMAKAKKKTLPKRTAESLIRAAKDIKKYSPDSPLYDDLATKLEQMKVKMD